MDILYGPKRERHFDEGRKTVEDTREGKPIEAVWWDGDTLHNARLGFLLYLFGPCPNRGENGYDGSVHSRFIPHKHSVRFYGLRHEEDGAEILDVRFQQFEVGPISVFDAVKKNLKQQIGDARIAERQRRAA